MGTEKRLKGAGWRSKIIRVQTTVSAKSVITEELKKASDERRRKAQLAMNLHASRYYSDWAARYAIAMKIARGY